jgi:hypothetical protein
VLKPNGWFVLEMSGTIAEKAQALLDGWPNVQVMPDLQGIPRVLSAQRPS